MTLFDRLIPVAFLGCLALAACGDHQDGYPTEKVVAPVAPMDTITQPNMASVPTAKVVPVPAPYYYGPPRRVYVDPGYRPYGYRAYGYGPGPYVARGYGYQRHYHNHRHW